jgi:hypothetical protein
MTRLRIVTILANKSHLFGLAKDIETIRAAFGSIAEVRQCDPLEVPSNSDLCIHLEVPIHVWMPWSTRNVLIVNPEWYVESWNAYLPKFDRVWCKDPVSTELFGRLTGAKIECMPWAVAPVAPAFEAARDFVWILGASKNKRAYVPTLLKYWKESYPRLLITTTEPLSVELPSNVSLQVRDLTKEERAKLQAEHLGHVVCSRAEGFGNVAAEAEAAGAFMILNSLPCYVGTYSTLNTLENFKPSTDGIAFLPSTLENFLYDNGAAAEGDMEAALDYAMEKFAKFGAEGQAVRRAAAAARWRRFCGEWLEAMTGLAANLPAPLTLPPLLHPRDCLPITIVTLLYNRRRFFDLACHSIMANDYPQEKIEWIIVEDSDDPNENASDIIIPVANNSKTVSIVYVPLAKKTPISRKRNIGIKRATNDIILMMDDDDHDPETSFRRRVAWLTKHPWAPKAVACTTIACYDLVRGISAVNSPPMDIPLAQRISEATLTFYKSFWEERPFPQDVLVGEGEEFITGRESAVLEIPPQQIIVAFSHGKNVSSRRIPSDTDVMPGCFWQFPKEFLVFIHGLAGIKVVQD